MESLYVERSDCKCKNHKFLVEEVNAHSLSVKNGLLAVVTCGKEKGRHTERDECTLETLYKRKLCDTKKKCIPQTAQEK